jgi:signal transduction histidine kinase
MIRVVRALWLLAAAGFVALLWAASSGAVDSAVQDRYSRDLRRLQALDARLNDHVLRSRSGAVESYDAIVQTLAQLHRLHRSLGEVPGFVGRAGREELAVRRSDFQEALAAKEERIEAFKSDNAVLRNSLRFFPSLVNEVNARLAAEPGSAAAAAGVDELLRAVLLLNILPGDEALARARAALAGVEAVRSARPGDEDFDALVRHARIVLDRKPKADRLVEELLRLPVSARAEQVDAAYSRQYHAALDASGRRRLALSLLAVAVIGFASSEAVLRLRRSAAALRAATEELQAANRALLHEREREKELGELKSRFVTMTSHEFRTPLSVILSSAEMLEAYGTRWPEEKSRGHHRRIQAAVKRMTTMLDGILLIGRAEAGALTCNREALDVPGFCAELVESMQESSASRHRIAHAAEGPWGDVELDEQLLLQILTNLLSNAIKYSPGGGVRFDARREGDVAVFEVADRGIGIPPEDQPRLFETFHRGSNAQRISGTGLGLAIVRKAVDQHGGTITFESRIDEGTRFIVRLPVHGEGHEAT